MKIFQDSKQKNFLKNFLIFQEFFRVKKSTNYRLIDQPKILRIFHVLFSYFL